jgi:hypothetical protein
MRPAYLLLLICVLLGVPDSGEARPTVVVNPNVEQTGISLNGLRAIFGMRHRKWSDGSLVRVFVFERNEDAHRRFCTEVLHVLPHQLQRSWDRLIFSGAGQAPIQVSSEAEMRALVAATPGAIGYLPGNPNSEQLQVLSVE